jgi:autotransporter-associated beta strand protein
VTKDILVESVLTGSGPLTVNYGGDGGNGGLVYLSNPLNSYNGTITVLTNAIALTSPYALSNATLNAAGTSTSANLIWSGVTSITLGGLSGAGNIALGANQLQVGNNDSSTEYSGALSGTGSLVKNGSGTFTLTGTNTYSGLTTISGGTLQIGDNGRTGTLGTSNVMNNATLAFNRADVISDHGMISGTGKLAQIGEGTLTLSNAHTYSGATTIESGTLALTGIGSIANSPSINVSLDALLDVSGRTGGGMTLASGQTLSGNGAVKGNLTLASGAKLAPGNSIGSMMFSNSLTLPAGSTTMLEISKAPLANDLINVLGNLTYGGTLVVTNPGAVTLTAGDSFPLFNALSHASSFNSLVLPPLGTNLMWDTNGFIVSGTLAVISTAPPAIDSVATLGDGNFRLIFSGPTGQDYELRASTNLALLPVTLWDLLNSGTFGNSPVIFDDLQATNYPQRFFRLELP